MSNSVRIEQEMYALLKNKKISLVSCVPLNLQSVI